MFFNRAFSDLREGFSKWRIWIHLAYSDIKGRYKRTALGPFWAVLSAFIFIAALGIVYSHLWKVDTAVFFPYFSAGYIVWITMVGLINESTHSFASQANIVKSLRVPLSLHIMRVVLRNIILFLHMLPVHFLVVLYFGIPIGVTSILLLLLGLFLLTVLFLFIAIPLAVISTRYRDFSQVITSIMQMAFFVTPLAWQVELIQSNPLIYTLVAKLNPLYQMLELIRRPLLGTAPDLYCYQFIGLLILLFGLLSLYCIERFKHRIAFWV